MKSIGGMAFFLLLLPASGLSGEPAGSWLQLLKLNQASQQELRDIQLGNAGQSAPESLQDRRDQLRLNNRQKRQQQVLQQRQLQKQMILNQRSRVAPSFSDRPGRPESIFQQQQFRQQQRNQLNRFRTQQQMRLRQR